MIRRDGIDDETARMCELSGLVAMAIDAMLEADDDATPG